MEAEAEAQRMAQRRQRKSSANAERSGETLLDLAIEDHQPSLGGHLLITLVKRNRDLSLPWNRLRVGAPVVLSQSGNETENPLHGVVSKRNVKSIQVSVRHWPEGKSFRLDLSPDEMTRRRQQSAMAFARMARGRLGQMRDVFMGEREPQFYPPKSFEPNEELNPSQQEAVQFALSAQDVAIIHGPPGTGKTTTVVELIRQAVLRGEKVLACAPSNTAVDNLLQKVAPLVSNVVRLGHPARVDAQLRDHTLDALCEKQEIMEIVRDMLKEAEALHRRLDRYTRSKPPPGARKEMRREAKQLRSDARKLEQQAVDHVLDRAQVVCATTTFDSELIGHRHFDLAIIDEACQSTEPGCWIPLQYADRVVLSGDHCQLPPTVLSRPAAKEGFDVSLLERLIRRYGDQVTRQLQVQYRMHDEIMNFSSRQFYDNTLLAHESVAQHLLADLPHVAKGELSETPVTFIDTAGAGWLEEEEPDGDSRFNSMEAQLVLNKVQQLTDIGLQPTEIAVIAPYAAQVRWLREQSQHELLEIDTVDGFQGREKEAVIISLVRSNDRGEIGFLNDTRRMNVALTRARRKLIVIGDSSTLGGHPFYDSLLEYFDTVNAYHSVWEEQT